MSGSLGWGSWGHRGDTPPHHPSGLPISRCPLLTPHHLTLDPLPPLRREWRVKKLSNPLSLALTIQKGGYG